MAAQGADLLIIERAGVLHKATAADIAALGGGASTAALDWLHLCTSWDTAPVNVGLATNPVSGDVYSYTLGGVTRYRLVPTTYTAGNDKFYTAFSAGACTGPITGAARNGT